MPVQVNEIATRYCTKQGTGSYVRDIQCEEVHCKDEKTCCRLIEKERRNVCDGRMQICTDMHGKI